MFFKPVGTGRITNEVYAVGMYFVDFFIYTDGTDYICFDTGFGSGMAEKGLKKLGIDVGKISHVFLTHVDSDHVGGLSLFKASKVLVPAGEEVMLDGTTARTLGRFHNRPLGREYSRVNDDDVCEVGNIRVRTISTPGHTPGSMCYVVNDKCIFSGDTLSLKNGKLQPFSRLMNMDTNSQIKSIEKLAAIEKGREIFTAHCGCRF